MRRADIVPQPIGFPGSSSVATCTRRLPVPTPSPPPWCGGAAAPSPASRRTWPGACELDVVVTEPDGSQRPARALAYPALVGLPGPATRVLLNTSALDRSLGTGGYALVVAVPDRLPADPPDGPGHLVKARYTPLQAMVLGVDEQESDAARRCCARPTTSVGCPWWWPTCTRRCRPCSPAPGPTAPPPARCT